MCETDNSLTSKKFTEVETNSQEMLKPMHPERYQYWVIVFGPIE